MSAPAFRRIGTEIVWESHALTPDQVDQLLVIFGRESDAKPGDVEYRSDLAAQDLRRDLGRAINGGFA